MTTEPRQDFDVDMNAEPTGFTPVVTHFKGHVQSVSYEEKVGEGYTTKQVLFNCDNVEVLASREPYNYPTYQVVVNYAPSAENHAWQYLRKSMQANYPGMQPKDLEGSEVEMQFAEFFDDERIMLNRPKDVIRRDGTKAQEWSAQPGGAWVFLSGGEGTADPSVGFNDVLLDIAEGKTSSEFMQAFYEDARLRSFDEYNDAVSALSNGTLLEGLVTAGVLSEDAEGKFHKVGN